jgi:hypothetical protein
LKLLKKVLFWLGILVLLVLAGKALSYYLNLKEDFIGTLIATYVGATAGAIIIFLMQARMEQSRFFQIALTEANRVFETNLAWEKTNNGWTNCEFRRAVGMAEWSNDPCGDTGESHLSLHIDRSKAEFNGIDWPGVVYQIDEKYCVASKSLHDYFNWYRLVIDAYDSQLLSAKHIKTLWRSITDSIFVVIDSGGNRAGMLTWTIFFLFGKPNKCKIREWWKRRSFSRIKRILEKFQPSKEYLNGKCLRYLKTMNKGET